MSYSNVKPRAYDDSRSRRYRGAPKRKPTACARTSTDSSAKCAPKSKSSEKEKLDEQRRYKRERVREAKADKVKGAGDHHNPPRTTSQCVEELLSAEEMSLRQSCLAAIEKASLPDISSIVEAVAMRYEETLLRSPNIEIIDSLGQTRAITARIIEEMFYSGCDSGYRYAPDKPLITSVVKELIEKMNSDDEFIACEYRYDEKRTGTKKASAVAAANLLTRSCVRSIKDKVVERLSFRRWLSYLSQNPYYSFVKKYADALETVSKYDLRSYVPPAIERHFILDIGPTNSGKTYSGMCELMEAESGVYLGPLRLLAMEAADTMNEQGCPCSLLTGEEKAEVAGARHIASTVEMLDHTVHYEVAVIDECQMITDPERGYAWAAAITSVSADTVHLCLAPEAEALICSILDGLDADYEIERHERLVPLEMMGHSVKYPSGVRAGDALIVFSRKSVQRYAAELAECGIRASMVYGALPYEVRKEEVRKFAEGETDVVVATDAIGMGLNLPVQRVLFAETEKYDGHIMRELLSPEVKQIAGRAGRYGQYEVGYVSVLKGCNRRLVREALNADYETRHEIRVDMPRRLIEEASAPLSHLMRAWQMSPVESPYVKRNLEQQISLARRVEDLPNEFVANAVEIPFKSGDRFVPLDDIWERGVRDAWEGKPFKVELYPITEEDTLEHLEDAAKLADLAYGLAKRYGDKCNLESIDEHRALIAEYMIAVLRDGSAGAQKKCSWCGQLLPAGHKHPMHDRCYRQYRAEKYASWDERYYGRRDWDDEDDD